MSHVVTLKDVLIFAAFFGGIWVVIAGLAFISDHFNPD